jgi:hypothetical protein
MTRRIPLKCIEDLPEGSLLLKDFARRCDVSYSTIDGQCRKGLAFEKFGMREYIEVTTVPAARNVYRYLTPDQQQKALAFWDRHHVKHRKPVTAEKGEVSS